ncbi:hypothetical protein BH20ACT8_BH20ACT8_12160 [soil metagenome]
MMQIPVPTPRRVLRGLLFALAGLLALSTLGRLAQRHLPDFVGRDRLAELFWILESAGAATLFGMMVLLVAAALAFLAAADAERTQARGWRGVGMVLAALGVDELFGGYEDVTDRLSDLLLGPLSNAVAWIVWGFVAVAVVGVLLVRFAWRLPRRTGQRLVAAAAVFVVGAVGLEILSKVVAGVAGSRSWLFVAVTTLEEGLELLGGVLALWAIYSHLYERWDAVTFRRARRPEAVVGAVSPTVDSRPPGGPAV